MNHRIKKLSKIAIAVALVAALSINSVFAASSSEVAPTPPISAFAVGTTPLLTGTPSTLITPSTKPLRYTSDHADEANKYSWMEVYRRVEAKALVAGKTKQEASEAGRAGLRLAVELEGLERQLSHYKHWGYAGDGHYDPKKAEGQIDSLRKKLDELLVGAPKSSEIVNL